MLRVELCWDQGVFIRSSTMETVCIAPARITERPHIDRIVEALDRCIPEMQKRLLKARPGRSRGCW
jgi:adenosylmethionine-8-amino-7-oxononanoate aminotransferase